MGDAVKDGHYIYFAGLVAFALSRPSGIRYSTCKLEDDGSIQYPRLAEYTPVVTEVFKCSEVSTSL